MLRLCATCEPEGRCRGSCARSSCGFQPGRDLGCVIQGPCVTCGRIETMQVRGYDDRGHAYAHLCARCLRAEQDRAPFVLAENRQGESDLDRQERGREAEREILRSAPGACRCDTGHCSCEACVERREALRKLMAVADSVELNPGTRVRQSHTCRGCGRQLSYDHSRDDWLCGACGRARGRCVTVNCRGLGDYVLGRVEGLDADSCSYAVCGACLHDMHDGVEMELVRSDGQVVTFNQGVRINRNDADRARPPVERLAAMGYQPRPNASNDPRETACENPDMAQLKRENDALRQRLQALTASATPYRGGARLPDEERVRMALDELTQLGVDVDFECPDARWAADSVPRGVRVSADRRTEWAIDQFLTARRNGYDVRAVVVAPSPDKLSWWRRLKAWFRRGDTC